MITESNINPIVKNIPQALSVYINQVAYDLKKQGKDIITLSLGEAFFDIPEFDYNDIDLKQGYHYSDSLGLPSLREKIAGYYHKHYNVKFDSESEILITAGSKPAIFMCMLTVLDKGDEVLIHEPAWLSYQEQAKLAGGEAKFIPYHENSFNFKTYFTDKTKMLILNNPNNPQGKLYSKDELVDIYNQCKKHQIFLLVDEAYSDFVIDDQFISAGSALKDKENLFIVNSLSKNFGMSGWRIGYVVSNKYLIHQLLKLNQHLITCAPTLLMLYTDKHFDKLQNSTLPQAVKVTEKRLQIIEIINNMGMNYLSGSATFYIFLDVSKYKGSTFDLAMYLLVKHGIAVVPGIAYGESTEGFIRISVGTEDIETTIFALQVINDTINHIEISHDELQKLVLAANLPLMD
ncbi:MAG: pyridoxal phosphate-dependent aminotransferase [Colwellia sp.]|jgi:Aspartate/tyrosine/aromatic aminotransferase